MRSPSARPRVWLFLFLLILYLLSYTATFHSSDGLAMFSVTENLLRRGHPDISQLEWMGLQQGTYGPDGLLYCRKGPGTSLLALPLAWLGWVVPGWGMATAALLLNALVTAGTAVLVMASVDHLGYARRLGLAVGLIYGVATLAWPYSKTFFSDPLAGFGLTLAALACLRHRQESHTRWALAAGLGLGLALMTRMANLLVVPPYAVSLWWDVMPREGSPDNTWARVKRTVRQRWQPLAAFALPLVLALVGLLAYNALRFGSPLTSGYLPQERFSGNWIEGIIGLLLSPGRGLLLYVPVLWAALAGWPALLKARRREALLWGSVVLIYVLLYGKWFMWHGGYAWGPRFLVPVVPLLCLGLAPWLAQRHGRVAWTLFGVALALSMAFAALGTLVDFSLVQDEYLREGLPLFASETFFNPRFSPLLRQWRYLQLPLLDVAWVQSAGRSLRVDWLFLAAGLVLAGYAIWGLARSWRGATSRRALAVAAIAALALTVLLLTRSHAALTARWGIPVEEMVRWERPGDAILINRPDETTSFAEGYGGTAWAVGLNEGEDSPSERGTWWLDRLLQPGARIWWLPNWLPPQRSALERELMARSYRAVDAFEGESRLALYTVPSKPLTTRHVGTELGHEVTLVEAGWTARTVPGDAVLVELTWRAGPHPPQDDLMVYVHLLNDAGARVAGRDGQPLLWLRPTSAWKEGEVLVDRHGFLVPHTLPAGHYTLRVGMYHPDTGQRLHTADGDDGITLGDVQVQPPG